MYAFILSFQSIHTKMLPNWLYYVAGAFVLCALFIGYLLNTDVPPKWPQPMTTRIAVLAPLKLINTVVRPLSLYYIVFMVSTI